MPTHIIRDIKDLDPVFANLDKFRDRVPDNFRTAMQVSVLEFEREVIERTPTGVGNSATGHLRVSVASEVRGHDADIHGIVYSPAEYASAVEFGTKPHFPPYKSLVDWVHFKLGVPNAEAKNVAYLVARKIARVGTKGAFMFRDGWEASKGRIRGHFINAMQASLKVFK